MDRPVDPAAAARVAAGYPASPVATLPADGRVGAGPGGADPLGRALLRHVVDLLKLAWPVMLSRVGILAMAFVDIAMLGRYGLGAPGIAGLGLAVFVPVMVCSIGLVSGVVPVVSRALGAGDRVECGRAWRRAMGWGALVSLVGTVPVCLSEPLLRLLDYPPDMVTGGGDVARALAPGLVAQVLFTACAFYLEATRRPLYSLGAMIVANLVNAALNWVFIFGHLGVPEMGADRGGARHLGGAVRGARHDAGFILGQRDARGAGVIGRGRRHLGPRRLAGGQGDAPARHGGGRLDGLRDDRLCRPDDDGRDAGHGGAGRLLDLAQHGLDDLHGRALACRSRRACAWHRRPAPATCARRRSPAGRGWSSPP